MCFNLKINYPETNLKDFLNSEGIIYSIDINKISRRMIHLNIDENFHQILVKEKYNPNYIPKIIIYNNLVVFSNDLYNDDLKSMKEAFNQLNYTCYTLNELNETLSDMISYKFKFLATNRLEIELLSNKSIMKTIQEKVIIDCSEEDSNFNECKLSKLELNLLRNDGKINFCINHIWKDILNKFDLEKKLSLLSNNDLMNEYLIELLDNAIDTFYKLDEENINSSKFISKFDYERDKYVERSIISILYHMYTQEKTNYYRSNPSDYFLKVKAINEALKDAGKTFIATLKDGKEVKLKNNCNYYMELFHSYVGWESFTIDQFKSIKFGKKILWEEK